MKIIVLDTETTGLLKPAPARLDEQPHIIEFYGVAIDTEFQIIQEFDHLIRPPIPKLPELITKITKIKDSDLIGKPSFLQIYDELAKFFTGTDILIAHNAMFDKGMIENELKRMDKLTDFPWPRHTICTVEASYSIHGHRLNLARLHKIITGKEFQDAHRAKNDVFALVRCVHGMVEKKMIQWSNYE